MSPVGNILWVSQNNRSLKESAIDNTFSAFVTCGWVTSHFLNPASLCLRSLSQLRCQETYHVSLCWLCCDEQYNLPNTDRVRGIIGRVNKENGVPEWKMPSERLLRRTEGKGLIKMIEKLGGSKHVASLLGLIAYDQVPSLDEMKQIIIKFNTKHGISLSCMPSESFLKQEKEYATLYMIRQLGGFRKLRKILGLRTTKANAELKTQDELVAWMKLYGFEHGIMPSRSVIRKLNPKLNGKITSLPRIARALGWECQSNKSKCGAKRMRPLGYFTHSAHIKLELEKIMPEDRVMPSLAMMPSFLCNAVKNYGGIRNLTFQYGWILQKEFSRVQKFLQTVTDLRDYVDQFTRDNHKTGSEERLQFPSLALMKKRGYDDLCRRIRAYGGPNVFGLRLGFTYGSNADASHLSMGPFSLPFAVDMLQYALKKKVGVYGCVGLPSVEEMKEDGHQGLAHGVRTFGGELEVGRRLGLIPPKVEWAEKLLT